jgi:hypothetical protein
MANIAASKKENDFMFIDGATRYDCPWFIADFISPRIRRLQAADPTMREFVIGTSDTHGDFSDFISLGRGSAVSLTSANRPFLLSVCGELENYELYWLMQEDFGDDLNASDF